MKHRTVTLVIAAIATACNQSPGSTDVPIEGTWRLVSETKIEKSDTVFTKAETDQPMIKILNKTHFSFLRHDLKKGKDPATAVFVAGAGRYELKNGNQYTEYLEYCSARGFEGNDFHFTISIQNDTLTQNGREQVESAGIDRVIIEKYVRIK